MKLKFLGFALLAVCVCAVCCMCGSDSKTPDYEFPDGPDPCLLYTSDAADEMQV